MAKASLEVDKGFRIERDGVSILHQMVSLTKPGKRLSSNQIAALAGTTKQYIKAVSGHPFKPFVKTSILRPRDFPVWSGEPFYKRVPISTWEKFLSKGSFRFGSLDYYRKLEDVGRADEDEGYGHLVISSGDRDFSIAAVGGFNWAIFCGSDELVTNRRLIGQFGEVVIKIADPNGFCGAIKKQLGAKRALLHRVRYADHKTYASTAPLGFSFDFIKRDEGVIPIDQTLLREPLFRMVYEASLWPSIFVKPRSYSNEQELRMAFEMPTDLKVDFVDVSDPSLLSYIAVVQN